MSKKDAIQKILAEFDGDTSTAIDALRDYQQDNPTGGEVSISKPPSTVVAISLSDVSKSYKVGRNDILAVKNVSLNVYEGEFIAITGASGSGKSTLLQLIGGLDKPSEGSIKIYSENIVKLSDAKLSKLRGSMIGFVFQFFYLQPFLKLIENLEVPSMFTRTSRRDRRIRANELLHIVNLDERSMHYPHQLSGGQLQRAAISRALMNNPKIILADEPTGNLDSKNSAAIIELFNDLRRRYGVTVVLVTHDNTVASQADRTIRMKDGVVI